MTELDQFNMKLKAYCYEQYKQVDLSRLYREIGLLLMSLPENNKVFNHLISADQMVEDTKAFFSKHNFTLHKVNYVALKEFATVGINATSIEQVIERINALIVPKDPFEIPRVFIPGHTMEGETQKPLALIPDETYLQRVPIVFSKIHLGNNITTLSSATYAHEITHTQLESIKGAVRNYHNKEVLSVFIEKISAYRQNPDAYKISDMMRLRHLLECISILAMAKNTNISKSLLIEQEAYVISILKAYKLFDLYVSSNAKKKKEMLANIQRVFDGNLVLEDFLAIYNITNENSLNSESIKRHLKQLT